MIPDGVFLGMCADDVSLFAQHNDKSEAVMVLQRGVDSVAKWRKANKMLLNVSKSEITFFSRDNREASWRPTVLLNGLPMPFNKTPKFLRVYLDRFLSFGQHVEEVTKR